MDTPSKWQDLKTGEPVWLTAARARIGVQEVRDNAQILGWAKQLGGWIARYFTDAHKIPWCGLFVDSVMTDVGLPTPGDKSLGAANWSSWGRDLPRPIPGTVLVFVRTGGGHVGLYVGEDTLAYHVLGGNQGDAVSVTRIPKYRCSARRWPIGVETWGEPVLLAAAAPLSTNEA